MNGLHMNGPVWTLPPGTDPATVACDGCGHTLAEHEYMYTLNNTDRYRCKHDELRKTAPGVRACTCGKEYTILAATMPEGATEEDRKRIFSELAAISDKVRRGG